MTSEVHVYDHSDAFLDMDRSKKIELIQTHLIPLLDRERRWTALTNAEDEHVQQSEKILAECYLENARWVGKLFIASTIPVLIIDLLVGIPTQLYGLIFSLLGTCVLLVDTDLLGRVSIASQSEYSTGATYGGGKRLDKTTARRLAQNTVSANIGLVWLTLGFLLQMIAVVWFPR